MFTGIMCYEYVFIGHSFIFTVTVEFTCCTTAVPPCQKHVTEDSTMIRSQFIRVSCSTCVKCVGIVLVGMRRGGPRGMEGPYDGRGQVRAVRGKGCMTRFPRYIAKLETGVLVDYRQVGLDPLPNKQRGTIPISRPVGSARGIPLLLSTVLLFPVNPPSFWNRQHLNK